MRIHAVHSHRNVFEIRAAVATMWTDPDSPRDLDRPAVLDDPDVAAWTAAMDAADRLGLKGRTLTQLLMGEAVEVIGEADDWVRVRCLWQPSSLEQGGYPGWVRRAHLGSPVMRTTGASAFLTSPSAVCGIEGAGKIELSFGTCLWVEAVHEDTATVLLPGGGRGVLTLEDVRLSDKQQQPAYAADELLHDARRFLGLRYLWGGTSSWGLDCSGLVHLVYRAQGVVVPRDAFDQADQAEPVPLDEVQPGDLYFFAGPDERVYHVGFVSRPVDADGGRWMLHAPEGSELVEDAPLALQRRETLVGAGRLPGTNGG